MKAKIFLIIFTVGCVQLSGTNISSSKQITTLQSFWGFSEWIMSPVYEERAKSRDEYVTITNIDIDTLRTNAYVAIQTKANGYMVHYLCKSKQFVDSLYYFVKYENGGKRIYYRDSKSLAKMVNTYSNGKLVHQDYLLSDIRLLSYDVDYTGLRTRIYQNKLFEHRQFIDMLHMLDTHYNVLLIPYMYIDTFYINNLTYDILERESPRLKILYMSDTIETTNKYSEKIILSYRNYLKILKENKLNDVIIQIDPKIQTLPDDYPLLYLEVKHRNFAKNHLRRYFVMSPQTQEILLIVSQQVNN